jgi:phosphomannomutase / phosphoglucomutase
MSGHMFFADRCFGYDDAIHADCRLVEMPAHSPRSLSRMPDDFPDAFVTPEIRVPCDDDKKFQAAEKVKSYFSRKYRLIDADGARIPITQGWGLARASNTQDILVLRFEADTRENPDAIRSQFEEFEEQVKKAKLTA